jgi:ABC-2 type transport system permease protein
VLVLSILNPMISIVTKREMKGLRQNGLFHILLPIYWILFGIALLHGSLEYRHLNAIQSEAQAKTYQQWLAQDPKSPHSAAHYGLYAYKPRTLLSIIDPGMEDYLGSAVWMEAHNQNEVKLRAVQDAGVFARYGKLNVAYLWQYLLPLIIILLVFNSVSAEYESGTLRMVLSTQLSARQFLLGKIAGQYLGVMLWFFLPALLVGGVVMIQQAKGQEWSAALPGFTNMALFYGLYLGLFSTLGVLLSAYLRHSNAVLLSLLGFWALGGMLLPRVGSAVAKQMHPSPSAILFTEKVLNDREKGPDGQGSYEKFQEQVKVKALVQYGVDSIEALPVSFAGLALQAGEERDWKVYDQYYGQLFRTFQKQDAFLARLNLFSPMLLLRSISQGFAGTDLNKHLDFTHQAEQKRREIQSLMNEDQMQNGVGKERGYLADAKLWQQVNQFQYQAPNWYQQVKQQAWNLFALGIWFVFLAWGLNSTAKKLNPA